MTTIKQVRSHLEKLKKEHSHLTFAFEMRDYPLAIDNCTAQELTSVDIIKHKLEQIKDNMTTISESLNRLEQEKKKEIDAVTNRW